MVDLKCPAGHQYEAFRHPSQVQDVEPCAECGAEAVRIFVCKRPHSYDGLQQPLVVWRRPDGTYAVPAQPDARKPVEYERVELRNVFEIRGVERAIDREEREKFERAQIGKEMLAEGTTATNRSELRSRMQHMRPHMRDFSRFAMDQNNAKPRAKYRGNFYFEALSQNASNRDDGRNRDGGKVRK
jgi:hypothetical protein